MWVVRLAVGGVYGPFWTKESAQAWGESQNYGPFVVEAVEEPT